MKLASPVNAWLNTGLAVLSLYGLLIGYATLRPQPDQEADLEGWARFVSSPSYLVEHVAGNVIGPVLAIFGTFALGILLATSPAARLALWGTVPAITGHLLFMVPGTISTFVTPPTGAAYLAGNRAVTALEFSPLLSPIIAVALLLAVVGNLLLGVAIWRSGLLPRWAGLTWIAATLTFYLLGAALGMATTGASLPTQPAGALLMSISSAGIAWTAIHTSIRLAPYRNQPSGASARESEGIRS